MRAGQWDLVQFGWLVAKTGYRWIEPKRGQEPLLTDGLPAGLLGWGGHLGRPYFPFRDQAALFRNFADTQPTQEGVLEFANQYGLLGFASRTVELNDGKADYKAAAEPLSDWVRAIGELGTVVEVWDLAEQGDEKALSQRIKWDRLPTNKMLSAFWFDGVSGTVTKERSWEATYEPGQPRRVEGEIGDSIIAAKSFVQDRINDHFNKLGVRTGLDWDSDLRRSVFSIRPPHLLGALWVQFALAISGGWKHRRCRYCNTWFEVSPEHSGFRTNRLYCQTNCRIREARKRQALARELASQDVSPAKIAKQLDTDTGTIRGWLGLPKPKGRSSFRKKGS